MDDELRLRIRAIDDDGVANVKKFGLAVDESGQVIDKTQGKMGQLNNTMGQSDGVMHGLVGTISLVGPAYAALRLERMIEGWIKLDDTQRLAEASLRQSMVSNDRYSESTYQGMLKTASGMQKLTGVGDELILSAQTVLQRFDKIPNELMPRVTKAMLDMAATTKNYTGAATDLGRASEGLTQNLRRQGIIIDENAYKEKGFVGILEQIEKKFGGQAELLAQGTGQWKVLGANIGDVKEGLGSFFSMLGEKSGVLDFATKLTANLADAIKSVSKETENYQRAKDQPLITIPALNTNIAWSGAIPKSLQDMKPSDLSALQKEIDRLKDLGADIQFGTGVEDALKKLSDFMHDLTATPYDKKLEELDEKFKDIKATLGDSAFVANAYQEAVRKLREEFKPITPVERIGGQNAFLMPKPTAAMMALSGTANAAMTTAPVNGITAPDFDAEIDRRTELSREYIERIRQQNMQIQREWEYTNDRIADSFYNSIVEMTHGAEKPFTDFFDTVTGMASRSFAEAFSEPLVQPLSNALSSMIVKPGFVGPLTPMQSFMQTAAPAVGAGAFGYGMGGIGGAAGSSLGYFLGSGAGALGGPMGAVMGGLVGKLITAAEESEPKLSSFDLLWETIDGKIERVTESWVNMDKDQKIFNAAEQFVQSQVDFFNKLSTVTGNSTINADRPDWAFSMKGISDNIQNALNQSTTQSVIKSAFGSYSQLSEIFGSGFQEDLKTVFMDTMSQNLGMFAFGQQGEVFQDYLGWKFGQFTSMPSGMAASSLDEWMNSQSIFSPVGRGGISPSSIFEMFMSSRPDADVNSTDFFDKLEAYGGKASSGWFTRGDIALGSTGAQTPWKDFFTGMETQINDIFGMVTTGMGQAFTDSLDTGEFETFELKFKQSIMTSVSQSLIQGFADQELIPIIFKPLYGDSDHPAITEVLKQYGAGDISFEQSKGYLESIFGDLNTTLNGFEPVWDILNTGFKGLSAALGLNTDATKSNTDAVLGPVQSFLLGLDSGALAPVQSMAGMAGLKDDLFSAALDDSDKFSAYSGFMTQSWLPMLQATSSNYAGDVAGIRSDVLSMPWVAQAQGATVTATDIGAEVAKAVAPMLLNIKEALGPVTIKVIVDGQVIKQTVIDTLDDPAVASKLKSRM